MILTYEIEVDDKLHDQKFLEFMLKVNGFNYKYKELYTQKATENEMREQRQSE